MFNLNIARRSCLVRGYTAVTWEPLGDPEVLLGVSSRIDCSSPAPLRLADFESQVILWYRAWTVSP